MGIQAPQITEHAGDTMYNNISSYPRALRVRVRASQLLSIFIMNEKPVDGI